MPQPALEQPIGFSPAEISAMVNEVVVEQHAEDAAFLWTQRNHGVNAPNFRLKDIARWDERVEAHLDGLRIAGEFGWSLCLRGLEKQQPGELFAAAAIAFGSSVSDRIKSVLTSVRAEPALQGPAVSALGWLPFAQLEPHLRELAVSDDPINRLLGVGAYAIHRRDPGPALARSLSDQEPRLRYRALKACGELGRKDLLQSILRSLSDADMPCRFLAAWSAARLGERSPEVISVLREFSLKPGPFAQRALDIGLRVVERSQAHLWYKSLRSDPRLLRLAAFAAGVIGDPSLIPDLIGLMKNPSLARVAGSAFCMTTGADLAYEDLDGDPPEGFQAAPLESADDPNVSVDGDENLPWPLPDRVADWWKRNEKSFTAGKRYLVGKEISEASLKSALLTAYQPQRAAAALDLSLCNPNQPLFEVRARGAFQTAQLKQWNS
jgi:uncharacterized protein (TIGR02270 family)